MTEVRFSSSLVGRRLRAEIKLLKRAIFLVHLYLWTGILSNYSVKTLFSHAHPVPIALTLPSLSNFFFFHSLIWFLI